MSRVAPTHESVNQRGREFAGSMPDAKQIALSQRKVAGLSAEQEGGTHGTS